MNLGEIETVVRAALGRGTTLDTHIRSHVKMVMDEIEARRYWQYMYREQNAVVAVGQYVINLPENRARKIEFVRTRTLDGTDITYGDKLQRVQPHNVTGIGAGTPEAYYLLGANSIVLDAMVEEETTYQIGYWRKSDVADSTTYSNWLTVNGPMVIIGLVLQKMAALVRNSEVAQLYIQNLQMNDTAMTQMDDDLRFGDLVLEVEG